tara:strand:- start:1986 stop:2987 length:1002 start_codon:yes stop_codon:yes gene_type:complete
MADEKYSKAPSNQKQMERIEPAPSVVEGILDLASENFSLRGADCAKMLEHVPQFIKAPCELVMKNKNNAWIVLGRDRPNTLDSGKGGAGETKAGMIDLCVGRMAFGPESDAAVHPNFKADAARIYISQRTDVDRHFALPVGSHSMGMVEERSAIAMKADEIRINARGGIKLVTGTYGNLNSAGQKENTIEGIDLIAGGHDNEQFIPIQDPLNPTVERLQPLVKGTNMVDCLKEIMGCVQGLHHTLQHMMEVQVKFNSFMMTHTHQGLAAGILPTPTFPSPELAISGLEANLKTVVDGIIQLDYNLSNIVSAVEGQYLDPDGHRYICSDYNNTN